jgi:hypothetical protein
MAPLFLLRKRNVLATRRLASMLAAAYELIVRNTDLLQTQEL